MTEIYGGKSRTRQWIVTGDVLEIAAGDARLSVTADEVYASCIEGDHSQLHLPLRSFGDARLLQFSKYPVEILIVISDTDGSDWPIPSFEAQTQKGEAFPVSRKALARGHVVNGRTWYPIAPGNAAELSQFLRQHGYDPKEEQPARLSRLLALKRAAAEGGPVIDRLPDDALHRLIFEPRDDKVPEGIRANLYPYQRNGWQWLRFIIGEEVGGLLADEMGLGKTLQVISAMRDPGKSSSVIPGLVLAPGSLLENWIREITRFCPDFRTLKHHGSARTGRPADLRSFDVVISSYDTAVRDLSLLKMVEWGIVVLDEAQNIRNPESLRATSLKQITRKVGLAVTGTPVENGLRDLWSIIDFVAPGYLGDLKGFEARYGDNSDAAAHLEPLVTPLILRRRVSDVAQDLPSRIDIPEILELTELEASAYDHVRQRISAEYAASGTAATLVSLGKLRQFCAHPDILRDHTFLRDQTFSKFERLKGLLEEIFSIGEKALVFTSYTAMADLIASVASIQLGAMSATLDGRLQPVERQPLIDNFSTHRGPAVLVLNPRAGGSGLNIVAANHVIHYNPEWNPALEDQASARAHRRGQERPVTVRRLICAGTVEEVMDQRLRRKRSIAGSAIHGSEGKKEDYVDILAALERSPMAGGMLR